MFITIQSYIQYLHNISIFLKQPKQKISNEAIKLDCTIEMCEKENNVLQRGSGKRTAKFALGIAI